MVASTAFSARPGCQFRPESGRQFPAESVVSLRRNQVVNISEFSF
jgi:hypothetical protein